MVMQRWGGGTRRGEGVARAAWQTLVLGCALILAGCSGATPTQSPTAAPTPVPTATPSLSPTPTPADTPPSTEIPTPVETFDGTGGPEDDNGFYPIVEPCTPFENWPYAPIDGPQWAIWALFEFPWSHVIVSESLLTADFYASIVLPYPPTPYDGAHVSESTVILAGRAGTAAGDDFALGSGPIANSSQPAQGVSLNDDQVAERTESFFIDLLPIGDGGDGGGGAGLLAQQAAPVPIGPCSTIEIGIWDDDFLSIDAVTPVMEGSGNSVTEVLVTVRLAYRQPLPITIAVSGDAEANDSATKGADWSIAPSGVRVVEPGQMTTQVVVDITGDNTDEPDETFTLVAVSTDERPVISTARTVVTIIDDDPGGGSPGPSPTHTATPTGSATPTGTATATLTVIKDVENRNGGTLGPGDFPLYVDGQPVTSGVPIQVAADVAHQVTEDVQPGYTEPEYVGACDAEGTAILRPGESATCTLLNNDKPPHIMLMKTVINDDGGTAVAADWTLFATAAAPNNGRNRAVPGAPGVFNKVYAGVVYTLSESSVPGYTAGSWKCDGEDLPNVDRLTMELGQYVTCIITNDDEPPESACIVGWGLNDQGQGCRPAIDQYLAISAGGRHSLAVRADGTLVGWGDNTYGQRTPPAGNLFVDVAAGGRHSLGLRSPLRGDGGIVGWGDNTYGQRTPPAGSFAAIAAGDRHSLGLRSDGSIAGWGDNTSGQRTPPAGNDFVAIAAGARHSLALRADGSIVGWGDNTYGQRTSPAGTGFIAIAAGGNHSLALRADGTIVGWGDNASGQRTSPAGNDFIAIAAGGDHSLALRRDRSIVGWGDNTSGQRTPPAGTDFNAIAAGDRHSLALSALCRQPDGLVRAGTSAYVGNDIYNSLATYQSAAGSKARGKTQTFSIAIANDGTMADRFRVAAAGTATTTYTVTYWRGTTNITAAVVAGTYMTQLLASGERYVITAKVKVKSTAPVGSSVSRLVTLTSTASPATVDAVKLTLSRK